MKTARQTRQVQHEQHRPAAGHAEAASHAHLAERRLLSEFRIGDKLCVLAVEGTRDLQHRLAELGLGHGVVLEVLSASRGGPFIVAWRGNRLVLGHEMTRAIAVSRAS